MRYTLLDSPLGDLLFAADNDALVGIWFADTERPDTAEWQRDARPFGEVTEQLQAYFAGELTEFRLELAPRGTPFQHRVWDAIQQIPYGTTTTYGRLAETLGEPRASRAVGLANGRNPIPIVIPCHRVIGADGSLTGYGGGMHRKQWLLAHEGQARET
jgi:methylated-DNA-[protein]-cysteine S-methyltransferase